MAKELQTVNPLPTSETRICSWCGATVAAFPASCPHCERRLTANEPDPATMTPDERANELQRFLPLLEVDFGLMHGRIEALAGRGVFTHELAHFDTLIAQVRSNRAPTADEWFAPLAGKETIVVSVNEVTHEC